VPGYYTVEGAARKEKENYQVSSSVSAVPYEDYPIESRIEFLGDISYYNRKELEHMWKIFQRFSEGKPVMTYDDFVKNLEMVGEEKRDNPVVKSLFRMVSGFSTKNDTVDFEEFVQACSMSTRGSSDEKLELAYLICDLNGDGYVSRDEVTQIMELVSENVKKFGYASCTSAKAVVDNLFTETSGQVKVELPGVGEDEMPESKTLKEGLTREQFMEAARKEPDIIECFGLFHLVKLRITDLVEKPISQMATKELSGKLHRKGRKKMKYLLRNGFLAYYKEGDELQSVRDLTNAVVREKGNIFTIKLPSWNAEFTEKSPDLISNWVSLLRVNTRSGNRFQSFSPARHENYCKWLINGGMYYPALYQMLQKAKKRIMIAGWFFAPGLYLIRDPVDKESQIQKILLKKAQEGVHIYVLIWGALKFPYDLKAAESCSQLNLLHPNFHCISHPSPLPKTWSHHQKTVVIDDEVAYLGGIDLCYNRYDDEKYDLVDLEGKKFPGRDYGNFSLHDEGGGDPDDSLIDRNAYVRMPWHDIHCQVIGTAVTDVAVNFIQKWNYVVRGTVQPFILPDEVHKTPIQNFTDQEKGYKNCDIQILRSATTWSLGIPIVEKSIYKGYEHAIRNAQHYVYIENQYFISSLDPYATPQNKLLMAIYDRVHKAIINQEDFKVVIVIPVHPAGDPKAQSTRYVMKYTRETIGTGTSSLLGKLRQEFSESEIKKHVGFYSMRNKANLADKPFICQIYIHAKLLIVDDKTVIIGSANINDRSMMGDRDSEIAAFIEHQELVPGVIAGRSVQVAPFARDLRKRLWRVGLGLPDDSTLDDPIVGATLIQQTAENNTTIYRDVYPLIPETIHTVEEAKMILHQTPHNLEKLNNIRGFYIEHPSNFLSDNLTIPAFVPPAAKAIFV